MIGCVYCGGEHERPADVRRCWADRQGDVAEPVAALIADGSFTHGSPPRRASVDVPLRRGPVELGRNVVVRSDQQVPPSWAGCNRLEIAVDTPTGSLLATLRAAARVREGLVLSVADGAVTDEPPESSDRREPYVVGVGFEFAADEIHHLLWSNSVDARVGGRWRLIDQAVGLGAVVVADESGNESGDIIVPGVGAVWLDGGPIGHLAPIGGVPVVHAIQLEHGRLATAGPNDSDADLAADQLAAVTHTGGAARIIAPAGSGKTRVLTERARHVLTNWNVPPAALTLVAFNKRADEEMRARTADLTGLHVRTLNAIALAIVNGSAPFAPQARQWRTIDEPDVRRILGQLVQTPRKLNVDPLAVWIDALSLVRLGLVAPHDAEVRYDGDVDGLADVWPRYRAALDRAGAVDFDDQVYRAIEVLLTQPGARRVAQRACRLLLVDEFQDLTPAHLLLIRLLAAPGGAVFGVGDDDQTIYGYNGADPAWLIEFDRWFPGADAHPLEVNYRCPAGVVEITDRLLRHNRRRVPKTIRAASTASGGWNTVSAVDPVAESVAAVRAALDAGVGASDIAVLTRVNATLAPVQVALTTAGVPVAGGVGGEFCDRTSVRAALAWLRLALGTGFTPDDIGEAVRRPSRGLSPRVRDWAAEQRDLEGLLRLAARLTNDRDASKVDDFAADVARLGGLARGHSTTSEVLDVLIDRIGLGGAVATLDHGRHGMNRSSQGDDLLALRQLARLHPEVSSFENWLRSQLATRRDTAGVTLSTVHRVKGQEWPHVVAHLVDLDQYPHRLADDVEEERRLLHVAITRCRQFVTIVSGVSPSPFVAELTTEPPDVRVGAAPEATRRSAVIRGSSPSAAPDHPLLDRSTVLAVPGLVLVDQGQQWVITGLEPQSAVAERNGVVRRFGVGAKVETAGKQRGKLAARPGGVSEASVVAFDRLRSFRDRVRDDKPAYTVFDDKTIAGIASALPTDLADLARVKGVGPAKLEQYGDDVLAVVAEAAHIADVATST